MSVCACDLLPPAVACDSHDHSDHSDHQESPGEQHTGCDSNCPCATCHSCNHVAVVLPEVALDFAGDANSVAVAELACAPLQRAADIFTPPKLS